MARSMVICMLTRFDGDGGGVGLRRKGQIRDHSMAVCGQTLSETGRLYMCIYRCFNGQSMEAWSGKEEKLVERSLYISKVPALRLFIGRKTRLKPMAGTNDSSQSGSFVY